MEPVERPKLRWPLDVERIDYNGRTVILLRDGQGIAEEPIIVPAELGVLLARFDGNRSAEAIAADLGIPAAIVTQLAEELTRHGFLETPETLSRGRALVSAYQALSVREAALAGVVYPAVPDELRAQLERVVSEAERRFGSVEPQERVAALICPHIDYRRGWQGYGAAYSALPLEPPPEIIVLIGTSHQPGEGMFHLTAKDFASPIGTMPAARDVVLRLADLYGHARSFREEMLHRREHSLELQVPFLMHRYGTSARLPEIVPILVGSFHRYLAEGRLPKHAGEAADFIGALTDVLRALRTSNRRVLMYAGIDLAHVGLYFGDSERFGHEAKLKIVEERDKQLLDAVLRSDDDALFAHMAEDLDARRICGFPSLYVMLAALRGAGAELRGHLIDYRQAVDTKSDCIVTFASAAWTERW